MSRCSSARLIRIVPAGASAMALLDRERPPPSGHPRTGWPLMAQSKFGAWVPSPNHSDSHNLGPSKKLPGAGRRPWMPTMWV